MLGRLNSWKGQDLLLAAISRLEPALKAKLEVRIVGGAYGHDQREEILRDLVVRSGLLDNVRIERFVHDPQPLFQWSDLVVVPSRNPEPFGRVAVEAFAHGRPVVAANHGGIVEVVRNGETGWLFEPNNERALAHCLTEAIREPDRLLQFGRSGYEDFLNRFTENDINLKFWGAFCTAFGDLRESRAHSDRVDATGQYESK
jgi:glycosyltransferase involved in cell wall biosynthesis